LQKYNTPLSVLFMHYVREQQIDDVFFALSHPVRRQIIEQLSERDLSVADVSEPLSETPSQMTKHIHILERAGLLSRHKEGRIHRLHMIPESLKDAMAWVARHEKFWYQKFDALEDYLHSISEE